MSGPPSPPVSPATQLCGLKEWAAQAKGAPVGDSTGDVGGGQCGGAHVPAEEPGASPEGCKQITAYASGAAMPGASPWND